MWWKRRILFLLVFFVFSLLLFYIFKTRLTKTERNLPYISRLLAERIQKNPRISNFVIFERKIILRNVDTLTCDFPISRYFAFIDSLIIFVNENFYQIWIVDLNGRVKVFGGMGQGPGEFFRIDALAVSPNGMIYVYDNINKRFSVFNLDGQIVKTISLNEGLSLRHIAVDKYENIYIHHPPNEKFPGFVTALDSNWKYLSYYRRGFLDGDILVTRHGRIIESNMFTPYLYIADIDSLNFKRIGKKPKDYSYPPNITSDNPDEFRKLNLPILGDLFSTYGDTIILQLYLTPEELKNRVKPMYRVLDIYGNQIGKLTEDIGLLLYCDDKYLITIEPKLDSKVPFNFIIYKWKTVKEIAEGKAKNIKFLLNQFKNFKMVAFISSNDCSTRIETIIREFIRFKSTLNDRFDCAIVVVNRSSNYKKFVEDLKLRYGLKVRFYELDEQDLSISTPSVYFWDYDSFLTISPDISAISTFHSKVDSLINRYLEF